MSTQLLKPAKVNLLTTIKNLIEDKVGKMAQSANKRLEFKTKPKSKKSQSKSAKRMAANDVVLKQLTKKEN